MLKPGDSLPTPGATPAGPPLVTIATHPYILAVPEYLRDILDHAYENYEHQGYSYPFYSFRDAVIYLIKQNGYIVIEGAAYNNFNSLFKDWGQTIIKGCKIIENQTGIVFIQPGTFDFNVSQPGTRPSSSNWLTRLLDAILGPVYDDLFTDKSKPAVKVPVRNNSVNTIRTVIPGRTRTTSSSKYSRTTRSKSVGGIQHNHVGDIIHRL